MVAATITEGVAVVEVETGEDKHVLAVFFEGLQDAAELVIGTDAEGLPFLVIDAVGDVGEGEAQGGRGGGIGGGGTGQSGDHGIEHGEREGRAETTQEGAAIEMFFRDGHLLSPLRFWNGRLSTMPITSVENL